MATAGLEVREAGRALRVQAETPHLVSMGSGRLSTAITLHPLPEGQIIVGSERNADIPITGTGVESIHCTIENNNGIVILHPVSGDTLVDGVIVSSPIKLTQGCILSIGRSNYMRFNNPAEAKQLKSALPSPRLSIMPNNFCVLSENSFEHLERKPPVGPKKSFRTTCLDDEIGFQGKLTKFEMLARQSRNCVSPKVFPAGSLTTNVPAVQILGHSRTTNLISLGKNETSPLRNLTNLDKNRSSTPTYSNSNNNLNYIDDQQQKIDSKSSSRSNTPYSDYGVPISNHNQIQMYTTTEAFLKHYKPQYNENNNETQNSLAHSKSFKHENNYDLMSRSLVCQVSPDLDKYGRKFDMSQSLIIAKTTMTEYFQVDQLRSNPNLCDRLSIHGSHSSVNNIRGNLNFGSSPNIKRIQAPSPSFNRNPNNCSLQELRERQIDAEIKQKEAEDKIKVVQEERLREQEIEKQEKIRLEEILTLCAEYDKQNTSDKPKQPNRIKTNGSLPRDKRPGQSSPFHSSQNSPSSQSYFSFDSSDQNSLLKTIQLNGSSSYNKHQVTPLSDELVYQHNNNNHQQITWQNNIMQLESSLSPVSQTKPPSNNENNETDNNTNIDSTYGIIPFDGAQMNNNTLPVNSENINHYENVVRMSQQNNNPIYATIKKNGNLTNSCGIIENKLAISNDDLLEAIEQLSMLSKSKEAYIKPKKNNIEKNNTKSNELKADKERNELEDEDKRKYIAFLQNEKLHILSNMDTLKRSIADIETQEEEISRELELEKALLSAEYESESLKLTSDETEKISIQIRINKLEQEMAEDTSIQANLQAEAKFRVEKVQQLCIQLGNELKNCSNESKQQLITEKLHVQQNALETEKKTFEDLEFQHLEEEASKLATREELQKCLSELSHKIEARKMQLNHLESQRNDAKTSAMKESKSLERQKVGLMRRLEEVMIFYYLSQYRNRLRAIDDELQNLTKNSIENGTENSEEKRSPSREDFDRISKVTHSSPIVNSQGSLGRKTIESLKEIERNRQLHLAKQGSQVISEERRRVEELKRRVQDEVRSQWEERKLNCASFNSVESGEESSNYSTGPTESGSRSSDGADIGINEKLSPCKLEEFNSSSPGTSNTSCPLLKSDTIKDGKRTSSIEGERVSTSSIGITDGDRSRPLSQSSSEVESIGSLQTVKHRDKTKLQVLIKNLRHHIETAGHQLSLISDVIIDTTTCSGYLSKMSKKFHHWNKRWFIFDRKRKTLSYYSDNSSKKTRGLIYFQSIEEVYVDHMNTVRSPQPSLTFIIKTSTRTYHLMAPSSEAMRVWVDVVFTGAEGYHEFDHQV
ncbi:GSCOCG00011489001-RA-CDS [Cotesia congregata]|nr:GSCOCG00011489001-RA-CDS [Cotesia congregata]